MRDFSLGCDLIDRDHDHQVWSAAPIFSSVSLLHTWAANIKFSANKQSEAKITPMLWPSVVRKTAYPLYKRAINATAKLELLTS